MSEVAHLNYDKNDREEELFAWTVADVVLQMLLGSISALSSILILYIIFKSPVKLKTTYHRIMALLGSFDICMSVALALATIPIPKSTVPYKGPTLGTNGTCIAQGFFITFGAGGTLDTTLCLAWYYVCKACRVSDDTIRKFYEPLFFTYIIVGNLVTPISILKRGMMNIRHWSAYCGITPIPSSCWDLDSSVPADDDPNCVWPTETTDSDGESTPHPYFTIVKFFQQYFFAGFFLMIIAMTIVILAVCRNERNIDMPSEDVHRRRPRRITRDRDNHNHGGRQRQLQRQQHQQRRRRQQSSTPSPPRTNRRSLKRTRIIVRQAIMYVLAYLATWFFIIVPYDLTTYFRPWDVSSTPRYFDVLESILIPLGGFWNMIIFVYSKILLVRDANSNIDSNYGALMVLLKQPNSVPEMVVSGMENVNTDEEDSSANFLSDGDTYTYTFVDQQVITDEEGQGQGGQQDHSNMNMNEEGLPQQHTSEFTSHPSAYDGLSIDTPSNNDGSQGLISAESKIDPSMYEMEGQERQGRVEQKQRKRGEEDNGGVYDALGNHETPQIVRRTKLMAIRLPPK